MINKDELTITKKDEVKEVIEEVKKELAEELKITSVSESKEDVNEDDVYIPTDDEDTLSEDDIEEEVEVAKDIASTNEELKITSASSIAPNTKVDPIKLMEDALVDAGMGSVLTENEENIVDGFIERSKVQSSNNKPVKDNLTNIKKKEGVDIVDEEKNNVVFETENLLNKFKNYITGAKFDKQCETAANKHGVNKKIVKNKVVGGFLGTIANILGLTLVIAGDIIMSAINFIAFVINKILDFAIDNLLKLINLLTLNCGSIA